MINNPLNDRNFDDIVDHFEKKVYGGLKGKIRLAILWQDIQTHILAQAKTPLKILDIGGGLGQIACQLAQLGHQVTVNDISLKMIEKAKKKAHQQNLDITFIHAPYQQLPNLVTHQYDVILCHAVLEWLATPQQAITILNTLLVSKGHLSLCFYNPVAKIYRNLIMGNFYHLDKLANHHVTSDKMSLTPNNPSEIPQVKTWLNHANMNIIAESGIRVFSDYVVFKRGGHENPEAVIEKEQQFSQLEPYKYMGRYFHIIAINTA